VEHDLGQSMALLERTPPALDALTRGLSEAWTMRNEGGDTFTVFDVLGHLIHGERADWTARARMILEHGESKTFERFDRFAHKRECEGKTLEQLLDEFARLRKQNLAEVRSWKLGAGELAKRGTHPGFGPVTLSQLLATWATHDLTHLHQISRIMAHQYRELVGPWSAYLGVLQCEGHSAGAVEDRLDVATP